MQRSGARLLTVNTFMWMATAFYAPFISSFYATKGLNSMEIGILVAVGPIASILIQPIWAWASDRTGRRRLILMVVSMGSGLAALCYLPGNSFRAFLLAAVLLTSFNTAVLPLSDALITKTARQTGANFARIRMGGTIGYAFVALGVGTLLRDDASRMFVLAFLGYGAFTLICLLLPKDQAERRNRADKRGEDPADRRLFKSRQVVFVLIFALVIQFGMSFYGAFTSVYALSLGYTQSLVGLMSCVSALSELPVLLVADRMVRRFGAIPILALSACFLSLRIVLVAGGTLPFLIGSQLLQSVTYMTSYYSCVVYISENVVESKISRGQSTLAIIQAGVGSVGGNVFGGWIARTFGLQRSFLLMAGAVLAVTLCNVLALVLFSRRRRALERSV